MIREVVRRRTEGWIPLILSIALVIGAIALFVTAVNAGSGWIALLGIGALVLGFLLGIGLFVVNPNEGRALLLFGDYKGTGVTLLPQKSS